MQYTLRQTHVLMVMAGRRNREEMERQFIVARVAYHGDKKAVRTFMAGLNKDG